MFLKLSGMIEGQLRDAYAKKFEAGALNQSSLADKLGVNRSAVHHRLMGQTNMTIETIADMVWGLDHDIELRIFDPTDSPRNHSVARDSTSPSEASAETALMRIASSAPRANTAGPEVLGGPKARMVVPQASLNYSAQLAGRK